MIKKVIQQGRSDFDARSVLPVREHDKMARTPLVAFFNIPIMQVEFPQTNPESPSRFRTATVLFVYHTLACVTKEGICGL